MPGCLIDYDAIEILLSQQKLMLKRSPQSVSSIAMFELREENELPIKGEVQYNIRSCKSRSSSYLEVTANGHSFYICKTTAVWLLQEGERVSADRLFRVRCKQPFSSGSLKFTANNLPTSEQEIAVVTDNVQIGQLCTFLNRKRPRLLKNIKALEQRYQIAALEYCVHGIYQQKNHHHCFS